MTRELAVLVAFLVGTLSAGAIGSQFPPGEWYAALTKPPLNPPSFVFAPVWTLLYVGIAIAGWRVWRRRPGVGMALGLWGGQLVLNALWSVLFFGMQRPGLALAEIAVLLAVVLATMLAFFRVDRAAGALFVPYALWVAFASYLNAGLWWLNSPG